MEFRAIIMGALGVALTAPAEGATTLAQEKALRAAHYGDVGPIAAALGDIEDPALIALAHIEIAAAGGDAKKARAALSAYLGTGDRDRDRNARAWSLAAGIAFADGHYREAAEATGHWRTALNDADTWHETADADQMQAIAKLLALAPRMKVAEAHPGVRVSTRRDAAGLIRATAIINGTTQSAVLDTGADLPTMSASTAALLHLRLIAGAASVSSTTRQAVPVKIGVADELRLAGFTFRHVPFLILEDAELQMPLAGGYSINAIIGFPVFRAMGSVTFAKSAFIAGLPADPARSSPLRFNDGSIFVSLRLGATSTALHLDTGASTTTLGPEFAQDHAGLVAGLPQSDQRIAGAGGTSASRVVYWRNAPIAIGGSTFNLPKLPIVLANPADVAKKTYGNIGQDLLGQFHAYTIDFRTMMFSIGPG